MGKQVNALQRITNFIKDNKIIEMQRWSNRKRNCKDGQLMRYTRQLIKQVRSILELVSGNDILGMLKGKYYVWNFKCQN